MQLILMGCVMKSDGAGDMGTYGNNEVSEMKSGMAEGLVWDQSRPLALCQCKLSGQCRFLITV